MGNKRNWRRNSSTDVQTGENFAKMIGKLHLEAIVAWCKNSVECLPELHYGFKVSDLNDAGVFGDKLRVNNTVVDNELLNRNVTM